MDHLGIHTLDIKGAKKLYEKSVSLTGCAPPGNIDPRHHLIGPYVSLRKVQKQHELGRLWALQKRQKKLKELLQNDRQEFMCELLQQGLTLYTDTLF